jgi:hypothetical protein
MIHSQFIAPGQDGLVVRRPRPRRRSGALYISQPRGCRALSSGIHYPRAGYEFGPVPRCGPPQPQSPISHAGHRALRTALSTSRGNSSGIHWVASRCGWSGARIHNAYKWTCVFSQHRGCRALGPASSSCFPTGLSRTPDSALPRSRAGGVLDRGCGGFGPGPCSRLGSLLRCRTRTWPEA